jgi:hypothetical protein
MESETLSPIVGNLLIGFLVSGLFVVAWYEWQQIRRFVQRSMLTMGTVVDYATHRSDDSGSYLVPILRYQDQHGRTYETEVGPLEAIRDCAVGVSAPLRYDPIQPSVAKIDSVRGLYTRPLAAAGFGLLFLTVMVLAQLEII